MNDKRRLAINEISARLESLKNVLDEILAEEQESFDRMPEGLQSSARGEVIQSAIDNLESASNDLTNSISSLEEAII